MYLEGHSFASPWKRFDMNDKQQLYIKWHSQNGRGFKSWSACDSFTGTDKGQAVVLYKLAVIEKLIEILAEKPGLPVGLKRFEST